MKYLILIVLITLAIFSYSNGKPIEDESEAVVSQGVESEPLESERIDSGVNFEEVGNYFEGDMQMTPGEIRSLFSKTGLVDTRKRWLKIGGQVVVPYTFGAGFIASDINAIRVAMNEMQTRLCVRFVPRSNQNDFIEIINGSGCSSYVGRNGGKQQLSLNRLGCMRKGTIQHELIHALGFHHMQSHTDRDNFVRIIYANIPGGTSNNNFFSYNSNTINNFNTPYDYESVMHYTRNAFGIGGRDTIIPRDARYLNVIGQRVGMSVGDVRRIRNMYQC